MIKQVLSIAVAFGGEEPVGWLPVDSAVPPPTPEVCVLLDIVLVGDEADGYTLAWIGPLPEYSGDRWYERLVDAETAATEYFGVAATDWHTAG